MNKRLRTGKKVSRLPNDRKITCELSLLKYLSNIYIARYTHKSFRMILRSLVMAVLTTCTLGAPLPYPQMCAQPPCMPPMMPLPMCVQPPCMPPMPPPMPMCAQPPCMPPMAPPPMCATPPCMDPMMMMMGQQPMMMPSMPFAKSPKQKPVYAPLPGEIVFKLLQNWDNELTNNASPNYQILEGNVRSAVQAVLGPTSQVTNIYFREGQVPGNPPSRPKVVAHIMVDGGSDAASMLEKSVSPDGSMGDGLKVFKDSFNAY